MLLNTLLKNSRLRVNQCDKNNLKWQKPSLLKMYYFDFEGLVHVPFTNMEEA